MKNLAVIAGTRPEMIKLAPVVRALRQRLGQNKVTVYSTGQHRALMSQAITSMQIKIDIDLDLMTHAQTSAGIHHKIVSALEQEFQLKRPDLIVVQGDTASAFAGATAGFLCNIPVAHVEAGLRTHDLSNPWPEEGLRQMIARIASLHLAPTKKARENLLKEGIHSNSIQIVGNPGIDSLELARREIKHVSNETLTCGEKRNKIILITMHRRESLDGALDLFCDELKKAINQHTNARFIWPLHPNPKVRATVQRHFLPSPTYKNLELIEPLPYKEMIAMLDRADLVISDSGGMQEEAPYCGTPIIVVRDVTERPEIIDLGLGSLIGSRANGLCNAIRKHLDARPQTSAIRIWQEIQGNGKASNKISECIVGFTR